MSDQVNFVVTNSEWDQNFDDVSIRWVYLKMYNSGNEIPNTCIIMPVHIGQK